ILDADKEGFLRSERSLIQITGRAARNSNGHVIMYADRMTDSMTKAIGETDRRRNIQIEYNEKHGITPKTIQKKIRDVIRASRDAEETITYMEKVTKGKKLTKDEKQTLLLTLEKEMKDAAKALDFERAAELRDTILELKVEG
ncbi:MAG TPA: UvrB/UvrC motif-containing protein, partial [Paenisporosarcina sp.]|nr:UvrB/UvrC motif-containing protein [Paenisporosarcina sp.]